MTDLKEDDFKRVLTMAINDGMDAEAALKRFISWIKAAPHRNSAFERLITTINRQRPKLQHYMRRNLTFSAMQLTGLSIYIYIYIYIHIYKHVC